MADQPSPPPVTPYLTIDGAEKAIAFYAKAFGATEQFRHPADDGKRLMHATVSINGGAIMLSDDFPEFGGSSAPDPNRKSPVCISLRLATPADVDATYAAAVDAGALSEMAPDDMFWGDRFALIRDPFGHRWMLASQLPEHDSKA